MGVIERKREARGNLGLQSEHEKLFLYALFNDCLIERSIYEFHLKLSLDKMHKQGTPRRIRDVDF